MNIEFNLETNLLLVTAGSIQALTEANVCFPLKGTTMSWIKIKIDYYYSVFRICQWYFEQVTMAHWRHIVSLFIFENMGKNSAAQSASCILFVIVCWKCGVIFKALNCSSASAATNIGNCSFVVLWGVSWILSETKKKYTKTTHCILRPIAHLMSARWAANTHTHALWIVYWMNSYANLLCTNQSIYTYFCSAYLLPKQQHSIEHNVISFNHIVQCSEFTVHRI